MKRSWIKRGTKELQRTPMPRHGKAIRKRNPERQAKRKAHYRAFMQSREWRAIRKAAIERAGGQCEHIDTRPLPGRSALVTPIQVTRCPERVKLTVHHLTYARFGGKELPEDLQVLCKAHHDAVELMKPHKWRRSA